MTRLRGIIAASAAGIALVAASVGGGAASADVRRPAAAARNAATAQCQATAAKVDPGTKVRYACAGGIATVETQPSTGRHRLSITAIGTGKTVDITGLSGKKRADKVATLRKSVPHPLDITGNVDGLYRAHTDGTIEYGIIGDDGEPIFQSTIWQQSIIGLQMRHQWLQVSWVQLDNRLINFEIPARTREDISWWPDRTVDSVLFGSVYYETNRTEHHYVDTDGPGVFYWELYNQKILDLEMGPFQVASDAEGPHFRCYKTVSCKYPNGHEA